MISLMQRCFSSVLQAIDEMTKSLCHIVTWQGSYMTYCKLTIGRIDVDNTPSCTACCPESIDSLTLSLDLKTSRLSSSVKL